MTFAAPVRPIGASDLDFVQRAMDEIAPQWSVELQGICVDEATLVLLPEDGDDAMGPSFLISRETCGFRLDQMQWDVLTELRVFDNSPDADPEAGGVPQPIRLLHLAKRRIVRMIDLSQVPDWAKAVVAAAITIAE